MNKNLIGRIIEAHNLDGSRHPAAYGWQGEGDTLVSSLEEYDSICRVHPDGRHSDWITVNPMASTTLYHGIATAYASVTHADLRKWIDLKFLQPDFYESVRMTEEEFWAIDAVTLIRKLAGYHATVRVLDRYKTADSRTRITPYVLYTVEIRKDSHLLGEYQTPHLDAAYEFFKAHKGKGPRVTLFRNEDEELVG
jgi:hypothetical protein